MIKKRIFMFLIVTAIVFTMCPITHANAAPITTSVVPPTIPPCIIYFTDQADYYLRKHKVEKWFENNKEGWVDVTICKSNGGRSLVIYDAGQYQLTDPGANYINWLNKTGIMGTIALSSRTQKPNLSSSQLLAFMAKGWKIIATTTPSPYKHHDNVELIKMFDNTVNMAFVEGGDTDWVDYIPKNAKSVNTILGEKGITTTISPVSDGMWLRTAITFQ
jgi:hypothetical protein